MRLRLLLFALLPLCAAGGAASLFAQSPTIDDQRDQLRAARAVAEAALTRSKRLERQALQASNAAARTRAERAAIEARIDAAEADVDAARARVAIIDALLDEQRDRLASRQAPAARLLAALQSLARRPELLGLVQPGSLRDTVHVRAMLGTMLPVVEARSAAVRADLDRAHVLRGQAQTAVESLDAGRVRLDGERHSLVRLEAESRLRSQAFARGALVESDRAIALGERARELVAEIDLTEDAAQRGERLALLPGPLPRPDGVADDSSVAVPAPYRLPVAGRLVTGTGELSESGVRSRGLSIATRPDAVVVAPASGKVVFARPFRGYGRIVILDHGAGWSTLLTGLGSVAVSPGQMVRPGIPVGRATGDGRDAIITVELRRHGQPIDAAMMIGPRHALSGHAAFIAKPL